MSPTPIESYNPPSFGGEVLFLGVGSRSHFFQFPVLPALSPNIFNEARFHFPNDLHFDLPASPPTAPSTVIQNPDTGYVFGGNRFQLSTTDRRLWVSRNFTFLAGRHTLPTRVGI